MESFDIDESDIAVLREKISSAIRRDILQLASQHKGDEFVINQDICHSIEFLIKFK